MEKLFNKVLIHNIISSTLEHSGKKDAILRIRWENMVSKGRLTLLLADLTSCLLRPRHVMGLGAAKILVYQQRLYASSALVLALVKPFMAAPDS